MWSMLIAAASSGDCNALNVLLQEDSKILEKFPTWGSLEIPIHSASMFGHVDFVRKILELSPSTSMKQLIQLNQDGFSPLHLAVANGHLELVMLLPEFGHANSIIEELCMKKDRDGKNPMHVEHVNFGEFLNFPDHEGNTILHLAAARKQFQTIEYLIRQATLNINAVNNYGLKGLDVLIICSSNSHEIKIAEMIRHAGGQRSLNQIQTQHPTSNSVSTNDIVSDDPVEINNNNMPGSSGLIVLASLIATASFEIGVNPPGGFWQEWDPNSRSNATSGATTPPGSYKPGTAIVFNLNRELFKFFLTCNTQAFMTSISIIIFLITPRSLKHEPTSLLIARFATLWLVIMFMLLFYEAQDIITRGQSPAEPSVAVSRVLWSALNICFALSPLISTLWKMLRKSRKRGPVH